MLGTLPNQGKCIFTWIIRLNHKLLRINLINPGIPNDRFTVIEIIEIRVI